MGIFTKFKESLQKTKDNLNSKLDNVFGKNKELNELIDDIEETLILSDLGMNTSIKICDALRDRMKQEKDKSEDNVKIILREEMRKIFENAVISNDEDNRNKREVMLIVGVNGVGKTTSIAKITNLYNQSGKKVLLAAADTFRAGAIEQLDIWAKRCNTDIVLGKEEEDPSSVIYKATKMFAEDTSYTTLICDTAGRLHNKKNLMDELEKMRKTIDKNLSDVVVNVYIVLDATTGQNAISQIKSFSEKTGVNGIILTKLDSTAKGGIVFSIVDELKVPVKYIGYGEKVEDIAIFEPSSFVEGIV